ncbi:nucleotidyltransferase family protein [Candidatus Nitrosotenuis sp. DW1]|uniref:nucleotidyltransferase family protein n=1 Tax=Candidatus Nitrosotenuis sp. DW1 TaxID=2259672 RepID=UPI0015C9FDC6|nr:nucleotidyltransferase family protein [Candidatus Nitrosotenuis sp. DW1]QLH08917.1 nucleotidyltransferase family protein [Candidatus Nitrosotenuis sp. DW1]
MDAIILAGGKGTRLKPLTDHVPKPLIPINSKPLIEWQIRYLKKFGIKNIVICTGYKSKQIEGYLERKANFGSKIKFSIEKKPLGTGGAIKKAAKMIQGSSFLVLNGDIITNMDIRQIYKKKNAIALIELKTKYGTVAIHEDKITEFREKKSVPDVWMNAGIYHLDRSIVEKLPTNGAIEKTAFLKYAKEGKLHGVKFRDSFWFSIDSHKDLEDCSETLKLKKYRGFV